MNDLVLLDALRDGDDADVATLELLSLFADDNIRDSSCNEKSTAIEHTSTDVWQSTPTVNCTEPHAIAATAAPLDHLAGDASPEVLSEIDAALEAIDFELLDAADASPSTAPPLVSVIKPQTTAATASVRPVSSDPVPQATSTVARAPPVATAAKTSHQRTKAELQYLREQVQELERQLETMRPSASESPLPSASTSTSALDSSTALWERIAERQLSAKHRAEVENQRLRDALESQLKIAQSLSKLLRKRPNLPVRASIGPSRSVHRTYSHVLVVS